MQMGDSERISKLVADTVLMLCKNSIHFNNELKVKGLVGVISDTTNIFLVEINETFGCTNDGEANMGTSDAAGKVPTRRKLEMTTMSPPRKMMALMAPPTCGASSSTMQAQGHPLQRMTKEQFALVRSSPAKGAATSLQTMASQPRMVRPVLALPTTAQVNAKNFAVMQRRPMGPRMQMPNSSFRGRAPRGAFRGQGVRKPSAAQLAGRQMQSAPIPRQGFANRGRMRGNGALRGAGARGMRQGQPVKRTVKKMNPRLGPGNLGSQIVMPSPQSMASSPLVKRGVQQSPGNQRQLMMSAMQGIRSDVSGFQNQSPKTVSNLQSPRMMSQISPGQSIQSNRPDSNMQLAIAQPPRHSQLLALTSPKMGNPQQSPLTATNQRMQGRTRMQLNAMPSPRYSQSLALPSPQMGNPTQTPTTQRMQGRGQMQLTAMKSPQYSQSLALPSPQMGNPTQTPTTQRMQGRGQRQLAALPSPQYSQSLALPSPQMGNPTQTPTTQRMQGRGQMQLASMPSPQYSQSLALPSPQMGNPTQSPTTQRMQGRGQMQLAALPSPQYSQSLALPSPQMGNPTQSPTTQRMQGRGQIQLAAMPSPRFSQSLALPSPQMVNPPQSPLTPTTQRMKGRGQMQLAAMPSPMPPVCLQSGVIPLYGNRLPLFVSTSTPAVMQPAHTGKHETSTAVLSPKHLLVMCPSQVVPWTASSQPGTLPLSLQVTGTLGSGGENRFMSTSSKPLLTAALQYSSVSGISQPDSVLSPIMGSPRMKVQAKLVSTSSQGNTEKPLMHGTTAPTHQVFASPTRMACIQMQTGNIVGSGLQTGTLLSIGHGTGSIPSSGEVTLRTVGTTNPQTPGTALSRLIAAHSTSGELGQHGTVTVLRSPQQSLPAADHMSSPFKRQDCAVQNVLSSALNSTRVMGNQSTQQTVSLASVGQQSASASPHVTEGSRFSQFLVAPTPSQMVANQAVKVEVDATDELVGEVVNMNSPAWMQSLQVVQSQPQSLGQQAQHSQNIQPVKHGQQQGSHGQQPLHGQNQQQLMHGQHQSLQTSRGQQGQQVINSPLQPGQGTFSQSQIQQDRYGQQPQMLTHGQQIQVSSHGQQPQMSTPGQQIQVTSRGQQPQMSTLGQQPQMLTHGQQPQMLTHGQQPQMLTHGQQIQVSSHGQQPQMSTLGQPLRGQQHLHHPRNNSSPLVRDPQARSDNVVASQGQQVLRGFAAPGNSTTNFQQPSSTNPNLSLSENRLTTTGQQAPNSQTFPGWQKQSVQKSQNPQQGTQAWQKLGSVAQSQQYQQQLAQQQASMVTKANQISSVQSQPMMQNRLASPYKPVMQNQSTSLQQSSLEHLPAYHELHVDQLGLPSGQSPRTTASNLSYDQQQLQPSDQMRVPLPVAVVSAGKIFQPAQSPLSVGQASVGQAGKPTAATSNPSISTEKPKIQQAVTSFPDLPAHLLRPSLASVNQPENQQPATQDLKTFLQGILDNQLDRLPFQRESQLSQSSTNVAHQSLRNRPEPGLASQFPALPSYESTVSRNSLNVSQKKKNDREDLYRSDQDRGGSESWSNEFDLDAFAFSQVQKLVELKQIEIEKSAEVASSTSSGQMERTVKSSRSRLEKSETGPLSQLNLEEPAEEVPTTSLVDMIKLSYQNTMVATGCKTAAEDFGDRGSLVASPVSPSETIAYSEGGSPLRLEESDLEDLEANLKNYPEPFMLFSNEKLSYFHCLSVGCRFTINNEADLASHYTHVHTGDIALEPADSDSRYLPLLESARSDDPSQPPSGISCPFPGCQRAFSKISGVYNHHLKAHKVGLTKRQKKALSSKYGLIYHCEVCLRDFLSKTDLQHHMSKTRHGK